MVRSSTEGYSRWSSRSGVLGILSVCTHWKSISVVFVSLDMGRHCTSGLDISMGMLLSSLKSPCQRFWFWVSF